MIGTLICDDMVQFPIQDMAWASSELLHGFAVSIISRMQFHFLEHSSDFDHEDCTMNTRVHLIISGRVQGVFYRASTCDKALQLNLTGWVRNCADGSVEAVVEGPEEQVNALISWCKQGPTHAHVTHVDVNHEHYQGDYSTFSIRY